MNRLIKHHRCLTALVFIMAIGEFSIPAAFADHDRGHKRGEEYNRGNHGRYRGGSNPYGYAQPVYVPPPIYIVTPPSPGINLVLPLHLRF